MTLPSASSSIHPACVNDECNLPWEPNNCTEPSPPCPLTDQVFATLSISEKYSLYWLYSLPPPAPTLMFIISPGVVSKSPRYAVIAALPPSVVVQSELLPRPPCCPALPPAPVPADDGSVVDSPAPAQRFILSSTPTLTPSLLIVGVASKDFTSACTFLTLEISSGCV